jgi:hypothetical protein
MQPMAMLKIALHVDISKARRVAFDSVAKEMVREERTQSNCFQLQTLHTSVILYISERNKKEASCMYSAKLKSKEPLIKLDQTKKQKKKESKLS